MTAYTNQWARIKALFEAGRIPATDLAALGKRHQQWFAKQHIEDATPFMTQDLSVYADHVEAFAQKDLA